MKSLCSIFVFLLLVPFSYGQLTVKPSSSNQDSYLYVNGTLLFVKQEVNLQKNADASATEASIYLRKGAQLIQGEGGATTNTGEGLISVFQEGTSNAYDYNYWSSPVSNGNSGNGNFGIEMLFAPMDQTKSLEALHTTTLEGKASPLTISSRWIYTYSGNSYSDWNPILNATSIPTGYGFSMKGVNGTDFTMVDGRANNPGNAQRYDFRGRPNNGPITVSVNSGEMTLVGNPFPSALDLSLFLLENSGSGTMETACSGTISRKGAITGIAYFWDSIENGNSHYLQDYFGGYGAFSPVDPCTTGIYERPIFRTYGSSIKEETLGDHYDRRFLPIAQGFMVKGTAESNLTFENRHRVFREEGDLSDFKSVQIFRKDSGLKPIPKIRLKVVINDNYTRYLTLGFWESATPGADFGMDAESYNLAPTDIGWRLNSKNYVIDVRPFRITNEIPLFLKVEDTQAQLKIKVIALENIEVEDVYIFDSVNNLYFPIKDHLFQIQLNVGTYHDRFRICFQDKSKNSPPEEDVIEDLNIFQNNDLSRLEISNPEQSSVFSVSLFDLTGKTVFYNENVVQGFYTISTSNFENSVYIVRVITKDHKEILKKISIQN